jgi:queuosine precursor transporter
MPMNELIFIISIVTISITMLIALKRGKDTLIALICLQTVLANLFVTKQITLFGFQATPSDCLAVGATLGLNLLQEYYTKQIAEKTIWTSFFCCLFYTYAALLQISYQSSIPNCALSLCFDALLAPMPRLLIASLSVYIVVQQIEVRLYQFLSTKYSNQHFIIRNYSSVAVTQLIDTVLFSFLGLYRLTPHFSDISTIFEIIMVSYSIKLVVILIAAPLLAVSKKFITPK